MAAMTLRRRGFYEKTLGWVFERAHLDFLGVAPVDLSGHFIARGAINSS